jgi:hypothetical protein
MKHLRRAVLALTAVAILAAPVEAGASPRKVAQPVHSLGGLSGSQLFGEGWAQLLSTSPDTFAGICLPLGNGGRVMAPEPDLAAPELTAACTVKPGTSLYFFFGSECSSAEEEPFFGEDAQAQRECALAFNADYFVSGTITVDDGKAVDVLNARFAVVSPQQTVDLPVDNPLGVPPQTATFVAAGWAAVVRGLTPGEHTITVDVASVDFESNFVATINVVPGGRS